MASFNRVVLMGNLTRDPEVRYTPGGSAVTDVGLAVNRQWYDKNANEKKEEVTFVTVTLWGRTAEIAGEYLSKGRPVLIEGRLQMDSWQDKETGQNRSKLKVVGENMTLLPSGGSGGGGGGGAPQSREQQHGGPHHNQAPATQQSYSAPSPDQTFYDNPPAGPPTDNVPF
jgi:single-strand DNA-binding protein